MLTRLRTGDVLSFQKEGETRYRRVLSVDGDGETTLYSLSVASRNVGGSSLNEAFNQMTAYELRRANYELVS